MPSRPAGGRAGEGGSGGIKLVGFAMTVVGVEFETLSQGTAALRKHSGTRPSLWPGLVLRVIALTQQRQHALRGLVRLRQHGGTGLLQDVAAGHV